MKKKQQFNENLKDIQDMSINKFKAQSLKYSYQNVKIS
jgi:hypothetical protein